GSAEYQEKSTQVWPRRSGWNKNLRDYEYGGEIRWMSFRDMYSSGPLSDSKLHCLVFCKPGHLLNEILWTSNTKLPIPSHTHPRPPPLRRKKGRNKTKQKQTHAT
ncbi:hypothetical protein BaRGS_00019575, partial [Batillaria attramentaria]